MTTYWITGASSGIGKALAESLSSRGYQIILSARNLQKLEEIRSGLTHPEKAKCLPFDLAEFERAPEFVSEALKLFGQIDVVILNGGISQRSLAQETSLDVYRRIMDVNYFGNVAITQALLPDFIRRNSGHFVVISSLLGKFGTPFRTGYSASKHALHGYYDSLRAEMMMQNKNISVSLVCPGFVATDVSYNALGGSGNPTQVRDEANASGMSPETFAQKAVPQIESRKYEITIGGKETLGVLLKRLAPTYFAKKISKARVR